MEDFFEDDGRDYYTAVGVDGDYVSDGSVNDSSDDEEVDDQDNVVKSSEPSNLVYGSNRKTDPIMTQYEYARAISTLAKLYELNFTLHPVLAKEARKRKLIDALDIAELHMNMKELPYPIDIIRPMPDGTNEVWMPREMKAPPDLPTLFIQELREEIQKADVQNVARLVDNILGVSQ